MAWIESEEPHIWTAGFTNINGIYQNLGVDPSQLFIIHSAASVDGIVHMRSFSYPGDVHQSFRCPLPIGEIKSAIDFHSIVIETRSYSYAQWPIRETNNSSETSGSGLCR